MHTIHCAVLYCDNVTSFVENSGSHIRSARLPRHRYLLCEKVKQRVITKLPGDIDIVLPRANLQ